MLFFKLLFLLQAFLLVVLLAVLLLLLLLLLLLINCNCELCKAVPAECIEDNLNTDNCVRERPVALREAHSSPFAFVFVRIQNCCSANIWPSSLDPKTKFIVILQEKKVIVSELFISFLILHCLPSYY